MSSKSSFRERLERRDGAKAVSRDPSAFPIEVRIAPGEAFRSPVSLAIILRDHGLGLTGGHAAVTEMAAAGHVVVTVQVSDLEAFIGRLEEMGLTTHVTQDVAR